MIQGPAQGLKLTILGNGGAVNSGLAHNSVLINDGFLVDCPHDIIRSLQTLGLDTGPIDTVYLSHFHGDHTFGFPFLVLDKWIGIQKGTPATRIRVYGPPGVRKYLLTLIEMAWTSDHPCYPWSLDNLDFVEIQNRYEFPFGTYRVTVFPLDHIKDTFGFMVRGAGTQLFAYMTDTKWCPSVADQLAHRPRYALVDINGGSSGIHMSYEEVVAHCLPITGGQTSYLGTHLGAPRVSDHEAITIVQQGEVYDLESPAPTRSKP